MYKLTISVSDKGYEDKGLINLSSNLAIPFDPANTDYANFKKQILADEAQLQDADGVIMADAKAYVASLP
jgi:hypothetical protein